MKLMCVQKRPDFSSKKKSISDILISLSSINYGVICTFDSEKNLFLLIYEKLTLILLLSLYIGFIRKVDCEDINEIVY